MSDRGAVPVDDRHKWTFPLSRSERASAAISIWNWDGSETTSWLSEMRYAHFGMSTQSYCEPRFRLGFHFALECLISLRHLRISIARKCLPRASAYNSVGVSGAGSKVIPLCSSEDEPVVFTAVATRKPRTSSSSMHSPLSDAAVDATSSMSYAER